MQHVKLAIIGSGPAGYTAAIYASRAQLSPVQFTGVEMGGQLMYTTEVENFPGFPEGVMGPKLMMQMRNQATRFGAQIKAEQVTAVDFSTRPFKIWTNLPAGVPLDFSKKATAQDWQALAPQVKAEDPAYEAETVIISTGASSIMLGIAAEDTFLGRGVSTCAVCDAAFYKDKKVFVVGGGDSAMEDTLALTKFAAEVTVIHRRDSFKASKIMQERVLQNPKVKVLWNSEVVDIMGVDKVEKIRIKTKENIADFEADGLFLAIGHRPATGLFADQLAVDQKGYLLTRSSFTKEGVEMANHALSAEGLVAFPTMTSVDGVFAAGDVVDVRYRQAITSAGQGCQAALDAERWLEAQE